ncbi:hypothetical protein [Streptomyces sp. DB-54]
MPVAGSVKKGVNLPDPSGKCDAGISSLQLITQGGYLSALSDERWGNVAFHGRVRWQLRWGCTVAAVLGLVGGCTGSPHDAKPSEGAVPTEVARTPSTPSGDAVAAYRGMWSDLTAVSAAPDPQSPRLEKHAAAGALELMKYGLRKQVKEGIVAKGAPRLAPAVVSARDGKVVIRDCVDGTDWLQYKRNGELKNDVPGSHFKADATVGRAKGVWKVTDLYMGESGSC